MTNTSDLYDADSTISAHTFHNTFPAYTAGIYQMVFTDSVAVLQISGSLLFSFQFLFLLIFCLVECSELSQRLQSVCDCMVNIAYHHHIIISGFGI